MSSFNFDNGYVLYGIDMNLLISSYAGYGIAPNSSFSALSVSAVPTSNIVSFSGGIVYTSKSAYTISSGYVTLSTYQNATMPKKVLIFVDADDGVVKPVAGIPYEPTPYTSTGRLARLPSPPDFGGTTSYGTISYGDVVLAEVWLRPTGNYISSGDVTDRRVLTDVPIDKNMNADIALYYDGYNYVARNCKTGRYITAGSSISSTYNAATSSLLNGYGTIVDFTGYTDKGGIQTYENSTDSGYHFSKNDYASGMPYDVSKMLDSPFWLDPDAILTCFDEDTGSDTAGYWYEVGGPTGQISYDTATEHIINGSRSLKVVVSASSWGTGGHTASWKFFQMKFTSSQDLRRCNFYLRSWAHSLHNETWSQGTLSFTGSSGIYISIADSTYQDTWSGSWEVGFNNCVNYDVEGSINGVNQGWYEGWADPCTTGSTRYGGNGVDWSDVKVMRLKVFNYFSHSVTWSFDTVQAYRSLLRRGTVVFSQDEGQATWEYTRPLADHANNRFDVSWHSANLKGDGFYPDGTQPVLLAKMARYKGYSICAHGYEHVSLGAQTRGELARRYIRDIRAMDAYGIHTNQKIFISAGGSCGYEMSLTARNYAYLNRGTSNDRTGFPIGALFCLPTYQDPDGGTDDENIPNTKAIIDAVETEGTLVGILVHTVCTYNETWTPGMLKSFYDYCKTKNVDLINYQDLVDMYLKRSRNKSVNWEEIYSYDAK